MHQAVATAASMVESIRYACVHASCAFYLVYDVLHVAILNVSM